MSKLSLHTSDYDIYVHNLVLKDQIYQLDNFNEFLNLTFYYCFTNKVGFCIIARLRCINPLLRGIIIKISHRDLLTRTRICSRKCCVGDNSSTIPKPLSLIDIRASSNKNMNICKKCLIICM